MQIVNNKVKGPEGVLELFEMIQEMVNASTDIANRPAAKMDINGHPEDNDNMAFFISVWNITDEEILRIHQLLCMANVPPLVYYGDMYSSVYPEYVNDKGETVRNDVLMFQYGPFVTDGWQIVVPYKLKGKIANANEAD